MARPRKEYVWGEEIGEHGIIFLQELESKRLPSGSVERYIKVKCPKCGETFISSLRRITRKDSATKKAVRMCQKCSQKENNIRIADEGRKTIVNLVGQKFGKLTVLGITEKRINRSPVWKCRCECGTICEVNGIDLKRGHTKSCGCLKSSGELKIKLILQELNINYISQKTFDQCLNPEKTQKLYFDFYLPDYNCCIEYDGEQHFKFVQYFGGKEKFERQKLLDDIKNQYCKNNNIKLIRIPYWDYNKLDKRYILSLL